MGKEMKIKYGKGKTEFGPGVSIILTGDEVVSAIEAYLVAHKVHICGPRSTITVNQQPCRTGRAHVDCLGVVKFKGKTYLGTGPSARE